MTSKQLSFLKDTVLITLLALVIGIFMGILTALFGQVLLAVTAFRTQYPLWLLPFLALAGLVIVYAYQHWGKTAGKGMGLVFQVAFGEERQIPKRLVPLAMGATWLTHLFGGSAGREGVAIQLGATVAHWFSHFGPFQKWSKILLITGMAAGFAGLFQTPLAATLFALEVLVVGRLEWRALYPSLLAALTASWTSHALGLEKFSFALTDSLTLTPGSLVKLIILGLAFGLCGKVFALILAWAKQNAQKYWPNPYTRIAIMGAGLSLLFLVLDLGRYSGLGTNLITLSFTGGHIYLYDWCLKLLLTALTLAAGFQGGEVTPLFAIGASLGVVLAGPLGLPVSLVAALGYAAVFSSGTSTFLGPVLIGCEVFGYANLPAFFIVCAIAYAIKPEHSIYSGQKIHKDA